MYLFINPLSNFTPHLLQIIKLLRILLIGGVCLVLINLINLIVNIFKKR